MACLYAASKASHWPEAIRPQMIRIYMSHSSSYAVRSNSDVQLAAQQIMSAKPRRKGAQHESRAPVGTQPLRVPGASETLGCFPSGGKCIGGLLRRHGDGRLNVGETSARCRGKHSRCCCSLVRELANDQPIVTPKR